MNKKYSANQTEQINDYLIKNSVTKEKVDTGSYFKNGVAVEEIKDPYNLVMVSIIEEGVNKSFLVGTDEKINELEKLAELRD